MDGADISPWLMFAPVAVFIAAAVLAIALRNRADLSKVSSLVTALGGLVSTAIAINALLNEGVEASSTGSPAPCVDMGFPLDPLRAWFLLIVGVPAIAAGIYAIGYLATDAHGAHHGPARAWVDATIAGFLASMALLVLA